MNKKAQFEVETREDGSIVVTTGDLHGEQHKSADEFIKWLETTMGGKVEVRSTKGHHHHHGHGGEHVHH